jgi:putative transposase
MPRKPRIATPGDIQHVIARGNAGGRIVRDDDDRRSFIGSLERVADRSNWLVHAYCLMDNHVHFVLETPDPTLSSGMQRLLGGYAYTFNRRHARFGHVFAGRFSTSPVDTERYAIEVCAYIVLNPLRAALVDRPEDWAWSSYRATAGLVATPPFLSTALLPETLHPDGRKGQELYRRLVREIAERPRPRSG